MRQAVQEDQEQLADLRALVLYDDLTRLGRYDDVKVRERFRNTFNPAQTQIIEVEGSMVGCVALKPKAEAYLLEHFYIHPDYQGQRIGTQVLNMLLEQDEVQGKRVILNVLQEALLGDCMNDLDLCWIVKTRSMCLCRSKCRNSMITIRNQVHFIFTR